MKVPLLGGSVPGVSSNVSSMQAINMYFEPAPEGELHDGSYHPFPGATLFGTATNGAAIRGMLFDGGDDVLYVVAGDTVYSVDSGATFTSIGTLSNSSGEVQMAFNPPARELIVVNGDSGWHYDVPTTTATTIVDADFPDATTNVFYVNGRFAVTSADTAGVWYWSDINDGLTWDALSVATAETMSSQIRRAMINKNDIWLIGDELAEIWFNSGDPNFVFERYEWVESGIVAPLTFQKANGTVAWLRQDARGPLQAVYAGDSFNPQVISTPELTKEWQSYSTVSDAYAYTYQWDGHEFYVLTFPTANATWAYDWVTQRWCQPSGAFSGGLPTRDRVGVFEATDWAGSQMLIGDYNATGKIWKLDPTVWTWEGTNIEKQITGPMIALDNEARLRFAEVQADIETGVIDAADTGNDRQLTLSYSKNKGKSFTTGTQIDIGEDAVDGTTYRAMRRRLGYARSWIFRMYTDTPRKFTVKGMFARTFGEAKPGVQG